MTPDLRNPLGNAKQRDIVRELRKEMTITRTYAEHGLPGRLFAYTGEYNGVEISIYPDGMVLGLPDDSTDPGGSGWDW